MLYFRHPSSLEHDPSAASPGHPDLPVRIAAIEVAMEDVNWLGCQLREAVPATEDELCLVHTHDHVDEIRALSEAGGGQIDAETYLDSRSYWAGRHSAGGACEMVRALMNGEDDAAFSVMRPAGHHAERERPMGFCLFNNVAVAAELAIRELGLRRVAIVDWDVHHGNGTAEIFRRRDDVLFASIHQLGLFPGTGAVGDPGSGRGLGYTINAPVPPGSDHEVWLSVLEYVVLPAIAEFAPELVLVSAGFDAHRADPLGDCLLDVDAFAQMACQVRDAAAAAGAPVGAVLEGGYNPPALAGCVRATVAALAGDGRSESIAPDPLVTSRIAAHVGHFWTL